MIFSAAPEGDQGVRTVGGVAAAIVGWRPRGVSVGVQAFVREVVLAAAPGTPAPAKALVFAAARLAVFGESIGLQLSGEALLCPSTVERFIQTGTGGVSAATRRTLRTNLRALACAGERYRQPAPVALPRERAKPPYTEAQIDGYLRLAACQSTEARRMRATALVCLGAGAGVIAGELRHVRGSDVVARAGGMLVTVSGARARSVPVLARFHEPLSAAACFAGGGLICGGRDPARRNVTDALVAVLSADGSLPRLEAGRLRSTWLVACARRIGLHAFMQAAGISCSQRLGDLAAQLPALGEEELVALLRGGA